MIIDGTVPKIDMPTVDDFIQKYSLNHQPVIVVGASKNWRASELWTKEYLRIAIGQKTIKVKESASNLHPDHFGSVPSTHSEMSFGGYIDLIWSDNPARCRKYLSGDEHRILSGFTAVDPILAPLLRDFEVPAYCENRVHTIGFWLSAGGVVASLHYDADGSHNLNVQVKGKKRVLLFSPSQNVYPFSALSGRFNFSQVNITSPDISRFPAFRAARCFEAVIEEGDMLFIPSYWYHAVFHQGNVNINVNFWWQPAHYRLSKTSFHSTLAQILSGTVGNSSNGQITPEVHRAIRQIEDAIRRQYKI